MEIQANVIELKRRVAQDSKSALDELLREGARRMLQEAIEREVAEYIETYKHLRGEDGLRQVLRNGSTTEREIVTPTGSIPIKQPRAVVRARSDGRKELLAIQGGERESQLSWKELLLDLKRRGMTEAPKLAVTDGRDNLPSSHGFRS